MTAPRELEGAELSAAVAEEVMGWKRDSTGNWWIWEEDGREYTCLDNFAPHASWADAMEVVEKLAESERWLSLDNGPDENDGGSVKWRAAFQNPHDCAWSDSGPTAICRAALLARAGEER